MADKTQNVKINIKAETAKATNEIKRLNGQIDKLKKQTTNSTSSMKKATKSVRALSGSFVQLGEHLARVATYYAAFQAITGVVTKFASFEQQIKTLGVVSGASGKQLDALSDKAKELGESTVFSASQVAAAMTEMGRAGFTAEQQLEGIKGVLDLAVVGNVDLAEASNMAAAAMNGFGLEASDISTVADVMARAANDSAQTVSQLSQAFKKVAPIATQFGNSLNETTAALEVMADSGIRAERAGTQLKIVMQRLSADNQVKKYLDDLSKKAGGVSTAMYDANGNVKPLVEQLKVLKNAVKNLTPEIRNAELSRIFGTESAATGEILLKSIDKVIGKTKTLNKSYGYASESAREMMNTLMGAYKELMSALEGLAIRIGSELSPALVSSTDSMTNFIRNIDDKTIKDFAKSISRLIEDIEWFAETLGGVIKLSFGFVSALQDFTGASDKLIMVIALLILNFKKLKKAVTGFYSLMGVAANPFAAFFIAIGLIIGKLEAIKSELGDLNDTLEDSEARWKKLNGAIADFGKLDATKSTLKDVREETDRLNKAIDNSKNAIAEYEKSIRKLKSGLLPMTDAERTLVEAYKNKINAEKTIIANAEKYKKLTKEIGIAVTKRRNAEIAAMNATRNAAVQLSSQAQLLNEKELKSVDKLIKKYEDRKKTAENTLATLKNKERRYVNDLIKLEKKLADTRKKYADERTKLALDHNAKIADLRTTGMSDLQKYNNAQLRAEQAFSKAKAELVKGNLVTAKQYLAEADRLAAEYAASEISHEEEVQKYDKKTKKFKLETIKVIDKTAKQTAQNAIEYENKRYSIVQALSKEEERRAIAKIKNEMALKKAQIELVKAEIDLQVQAIELMTKMISQITGIKWDEDLNRAKEHIKDIEKNIDAIFDKQRQMKIQAVPDPVTLNETANKITDEVEKKADAAKIKPKVDADTTQVNDKLKYVENEFGQIVSKLELDTSDAEGGFYEFTSRNTKTGITTDLLLDDDPAQQQFNTLKNHIEATSPTSKLNFDTRAAIQKDNAFVAKAKRPISRRLDTYEVFHPAPIPRKTGGLIPRFNSGGHLDNGIGHSRKTGKLPGYGGGDKIKALLEAGEFIIRKEAVKALGLERLNILNQGMLPRYNQGGVVAKVPRFSSGGSVNPLRTVNLNLNIGGRTFATLSDESVATALSEYLTRSTL